MCSYKMETLEAYIRSQDHTPWPRTSVPTRVGPFLHALPHVYASLTPAQRRTLGIFLDSLTSLTSTSFPEAIDLTAQVAGSERVQRFLDDLKDEATAVTLLESAMKRHFQGYVRRLEDDPYTPAPRLDEYVAEQRTAVRGTRTSDALPIWWRGLRLPEQVVPIEGYRGSDVIQDPGTTEVLYWFVFQWIMHGSDICVDPEALVLTDVGGAITAKSTVLPLTLCVDAPLYVKPMIILRGDEGHMNMLIFRTHGTSKTVTRFEPHGTAWDDVDAYLSTPWLAEAAPDYTYTPLDVACPTLPRRTDISVGPQSLHESHYQNGFCGVWSMYFVHLVFLNPTEPLEHLYAFLVSRPSAEILAVLRKYLCWMGAVALEALIEPQFWPPYMYLRWHIAEARASLQNVACGTL